MYLLHRHYDYGKCLSHNLKKSMYRREANEWSVVLKLDYYKISHRRFIKCGSAKQIIPSLLVPCNPMPIVSTLKDQERSTISESSGLNRDSLVTISTDGGWNPQGGSCGTCERQGRPDVDMGPVRGNWRKRRRGPGRSARAAAIYTEIDSGPAVALGASIGGRGAEPPTYPRAAKWPRENKTRRESAVTRRMLPGSEQCQFPGYNKFHHWPII